MCESLAILCQLMILVVGVYTIVLSQNGTTALIEAAKDGVGGMIHMLVTPQTLNKKDKVSIHHNYTVWVKFNKSKLQLLVKP